jgi:putative membrane protein
LVARHYHHLFDGVALHWAIARRIHLFVTVDWATDPFTRFFMEALIRAARWPAVLRADALKRGAQSMGLQSRSVFTAADLSRYQRRAVHDSIGLLREGRLLVIFPEGYPNIDPHYTPKIHAQQMLPFKSGFAAIAAAAERRLGASIPLVPVGIRYTVDAKWTAHVSFGDPLSAGDFVSRQTLVKKLEHDVAALSNLSPPEENSGRNNNP